MESDVSDCQAANLNFNLNFHMKIKLANSHNVSLQRKRWRSKRRRWVSKFILCNFSVRRLPYFLKNWKKNASKNIKNLPSEVAQYPPWLTVFIPASFFFVKLRQFYSLIYSHLWTFQTLQDEKIRKNTLPITLISLHLGILFMKIVL